MKKYSYYQQDKKVKWTKFKIIVPTEKDRKELMEAFEYFHNSDIDTDYITVNQLAHEYLDNTRVKGAKNNIIVNKELYNQLKEENGNII